jgi:protein-tyrosine phosphatase
MIDIHSHILPGIDDGPKTLEESFELAKLYVRAGFSGVVATPHWIGGSVWMPDAARVSQAVADLNVALESHGIDLKLYPGMEIAMDSGIAGLFDKNMLLSIAGTSYVLVEAPFQQMPAGWEQVFFELMSSGFRVVLAHPERCAQFGQRPGMVEEMVDSGVYVQVNYDSLLGYNGGAVRESAYRLILKGHVHCLATDSHDPINRNPESAVSGRKEVEKAAGPKAAEIMTLINPKRIISGLDLQQVHVEVKKKKKRWWKF